uniref:Uncharacterized protein n=1 Tax=Salix viminalis TaxID=40686 RepID=A0A6N2M7W3_SALVM
MNEWMTVGPTNRNPLFTMSLLMVSDFEVLTGHFPLLAAGGGGDFNLGEMGGDSSEGCLVFVPAALPAGCINGIGGTAAGSGAGDFAGESLLSGWLRSKLGT